MQKVVKCKARRERGEARLFLVCIHIHGWSYGGVLVFHFIPCRGGRFGCGSCLLFRPSTFDVPYPRKPKYLSLSLEAWTVSDNLAPSGSPGSLNLCFPVLTLS
jgi:hypothetical protein